MHSKEIGKVRDKDGRVDITPFFASKGDVNFYNGIFKTSDGQSIFWKRCQTNTFFDYGEVIASHIARQFGLRSSKYFFAKLYDFNGVIAKDYKMPGETELLGSDFLSDCYKQMNQVNFCPDTNTLNCFEFINKALIYCVQCGKMTEREATNILSCLIKQSFLDFAISNFDRHSGNWGLLKSQTGAYRFIPVFDSGRCFGFYHSKQTFADVINPYLQNPNKANACKMDSFFKGLDKGSNLAFGLKEKKQLYANQNTNMQFLKGFQKMYPNYFDSLLLKFYQLDLKKVFASVQTETGVALPGYIKAIVVNSYETRYIQAKKHFSNELKAVPICQIAFEL